MATNDPLFSDLSTTLSIGLASQHLGHLQIDLNSRALRRARDEVGAALTHRVNEPLTALLLYLHEIIVAEGPFPSMEALQKRREMAEKALNETERLCELIGLIDGSSGEPADPNIVLERGSRARKSAPSNNAEDGRPASSTTSEPGPHLLTPREREVLALITSGTSNKAGGHRLGISTRTFEVHRARIMLKLQARNTADLVRFALSESC